MSTPRGQMGIVLTMLLIAMLLWILGTIEKTAADEPPRTIQTKIEKIQGVLPKWLESGGDPKEIGPRMEKFQRLMQSGNYKEAEAQLDEVLVVLQETKGTDFEKKRAVGKSSAKEPYIGQPRKVKLAKLPSDAAIIFVGPRRDTQKRAQLGASIYAMTADRQNVTQITFDEQPHHREQVAVSPDRTKIAENRYISGHPTLWVDDLQLGTEVQLVPEFFQAGGSSMFWGKDGFIYFAGTPSEAEHHPAPGAAANLYKIRPDGTGLSNLTFTAGDEAVADPNISEDRTLVTYLRGRFIKGAPDVQIWAMNIDGSNDRLVFDAGAALAHDPSPSPDHKRVVFSRSNHVFHNFPKIPGLNDAHDLYIVDMDGSGLKRLTAPGPLSIVPKWSSKGILYTEISEKDEYKGLVLIQPDGTGKTRLGPRGDQLVKDGGVLDGASLASWLPR